MALGDWFRRFFASALESPTEDSTLREEYGTPETEADAERPDIPMAIPASGGIAPGGRPGAPATTEAQEGEIEGEELPHEPTP